MTSHKGTSRVLHQVDTSNMISRPAAVTVKGHRSQSQCCRIPLCCGRLCHCYVSEQCLLQLCVYRWPQAALLKVCLLQQLREQLAVAATASWVWVASGHFANAVVCSRLLQKCSAGGLRLPCLMLECIPSTGGAPESCSVLQHLC